MHLATDPAFKGVVAAVCSTRLQAGPPRGVTWRWLALHRGQRPLSGHGGSTWCAGVGGPHDCNTKNAAVVAVVGPVALCVDAAVDVPVAAGRL